MRRDPFLLALVLAGMLVIAGCKQSSEPPPGPGMPGGPTVAPPGKGPAPTIIPPKAK